MPGYGGVDSATVLALAAFESSVNPPRRPPAEHGRSLPIGADGGPRRWCAGFPRRPARPSSNSCVTAAARDRPVWNSGDGDRALPRCGRLDHRPGHRGHGIRHHRPQRTVGRRPRSGRDHRRLRQSRPGGHWAICPDHAPQAAPAANYSADLSFDSAGGLGDESAANTRAPAEVPAESVSPETALDAHLETHVFEGRRSGTRYLARRITNFVEDGHSWSDVALICRNANSARSIANRAAACGLSIATLMQPLNVDPATAPLLELLSTTPDFDDDESIAEPPVPGRQHLRSARPRANPPLPPHRAPPVPAPPAAPPLSRWRCAAPSTDPSPQALATISRMLHAAAAVGTDDPHQALWTIWEAAGVAQKWAAPKPCRTPSP